MTTAETIHLKQRLIPFTDRWVVSISLFTATKALGGDHSTLQGILLRSGVRRSEVSEILASTEDLTTEVAHRVVVANTDYIANVGTAIEPAIVRISAEAANSRPGAVHIDAEDVLAKAAVSRERRKRNGR
jgi:hypothetical protein